MRRTRTPLRFVFLLLLAITSAGAQTAEVPLLLPGGLAFDASGNLYFAETARHQVRRLTPSGVLTVVAGLGTQGFAGDGGPANGALLDSPTAVALDRGGNLFVADTHNGRIRRVDAANGLISTYASTPMPVGLAFDSAGRLVYADAVLNEVLRIETSGAKTLLAGDGVQGSGGDGGLATAARLDAPSGIAFDGEGNLFIADTHNHAVRRVDVATGLISTVTQQVRLPRGLVLDASGDVYVADAGGNRVLRVDAISGAVTAVAGGGVQGFAGDGSGAALAEVDAPLGVGLSAQGAVTFTDSANGRVRQVDAKGTVRTIAGVGAASVVPAKAATVTMLTQNGQTLNVAVSSSTGVPTGIVSLSDGGLVVASAALSSGTARFSAAGFSAGSHTLEAVYGGNEGLAGSSSAVLLVMIGGLVPGDFTLASRDTGSAMVPAGRSGSFSFLVTPTGAPLASRIVLSVTGLPAGATASFAPGFLPPPGDAAPFTLTVQTLARAAELRWTGGVVFAGFLTGIFFGRRRKAGLVAGLVLLAGCGARVNTGSGGGVTPVSYNLTVTASATSSTGVALVHSVGVVLTVE